ncbi:MAG: hypothetical protein Q9219_000741 [cf. Caloplaca sp. 3 TL-2023]
MAFIPSFLTLLLLVVPTLAIRPAVRRGSPIPSPSYVFGTAIGGALDMPEPTGPPDPTQRAKELDANVLNVRITNSFGYPLPISYNSNAGSPTIIGNPGAGVFDRAASTNIAVPRNFAGKFNAVPFSLAKPTTPQTQKSKYPSTLPADTVLVSMSPTSMATASRSHAHAPVFPSQVATSLFSALVGLARTKGRVIVSYATILKSLSMMGRRIISFSHARGRRIHTRTMERRMHMGSVIPGIFSVVSE